MDGYAQRSLHFSTLLPITVAPRLWWRTSTSPTHGRPAEKPSAKDNAGNGFGGPWPGSPQRNSATRLTSMAARRGLAVIGVDPAYTSMWGRQHWRKPLQQQTSDPATVTVHHGAAAAIGRRGLGTPIRRRPAGPRTQQRMRAGTPPARPDQPSSTTRQCESSGSPPRPPRRRGMPVHQKTPTVSGQHRSGRTPAELTSAH